MQRFSIRGYLQAARRLQVPPRVVLLLLLIELGSVLFEVGGVAMLLPVFQYMQEGGALETLAQSHAHWAYLIDAFGWAGVPVNLATLLGASFLLILMRQAMTYVRTVYRVAIRQRLAHRLRCGVFDSYIHTRYDYQRDTEKGGLINDVTIELPKAVNALFDVVLAVGHFLLIAVYTTGLFYLSASITLATLAMVAVAVLILKRVMRLTQETSERITQANRSFGGFLAQRVRATRLIRLSGAEEMEGRRLEALSDSCRDRTVHLSRLSALTQVLVEPIIILTVFGVIFIGYSFAGLGAESLGIFAIALARLLPVIRSAIGDFQTVLGQWASLQAVLARFDDFNDLMEPAGEGRPFERLERAIRFQDVRYAYPFREEPALVGLTLTIPAATTTAIVGPSGSGKSTLVDLLPRLIEPQSGDITLDGVSLQVIDRRALRRAIAFVGQQAEVLDATPRAHICYGVAAPDEAAMRRAAELAGALDFVEALPDGFDTPIGEGGSGLSGGQRQRLDVARALMRGASILVLDEPTSQLDVDSQRALRDALRRIRAETQTTILIVSHTLDLARDADLVVVMSKGEALQAGPPAELLADEGWFARIAAPEPERAGTD